MNEKLHKSTTSVAKDHLINLFYFQGRHNWPWRRTLEIRFICNWRYLKVCVNFLNFFTLKHVSLKTNEGGNRTENRVKPAGEKFLHAFCLTKFKN